MFRVKKKVAVIALSLLVISLISVIGYSAPKPAPLTIAMPTWGGSTDPLLMDEVKKEMEKQTNTIIKMIAPPANTYSDKINVLLSSGDIPDVFRINKAMVNVHTFTARGFAAPLDKYVKKSKYLKNVEPKYFDYMRSAKGDIYALPRLKEQQKVIWARKEILDKYNVKLSSTPTTEEFLSEMLKVKKNSDIVPFSYSKFLDNLPFLYSSFGAYPEFVKDKKGKYFDSFNTPEMREAHVYINRLYKEGVLDQEFPTNDNSAMRNKLISGRAASNLDYDNRYFFYLDGITRVEPDSKVDLVPIFKLAGPNGQGGTLNEAIQDAYMVSATSKYKQAATDFIAWMCYSAEGIKTVMVGVPGKHYVVVNGVGKLTPQAEAGGQSLSMNSVMGMFVDVKDLNLGFKFPDQDMFSKYLDLTKDINKHTGPKYVIPAGISPLYDKYSASLTKKRQELGLKMILGIASIEDAYKEYDAFFKSINGAQILKELNTKK